jgi:hypothetical protein
MSTPFQDPKPGLTSSEHLQSLGELGLPMSLRLSLVENHYDKSLLICWVMTLINLYLLDGSPSSHDWILDYANSSFDLSGKMGSSLVGLGPAPGAASRRLVG